MSKAIANLQVQRQQCKSSRSALRTQAVQECPSLFHTLRDTRFGLTGSGYRTPCVLWMTSTSGLRDSWGFFFPSLSPWIAAYVSKLPWWLWMLPACPQLSCNIWSGVLVCQWAGLSLKNIFVCKRCFLKIFQTTSKTTSVF